MDDFCLSCREGGRDWDSSRKMDGDRPWQGTHLETVDGILLYDNILWCCKCCSLGVCV